MLCELRDEPTVELLQFSVQIRYPEPVIAPKVGQRPILPYQDLRAETLRVIRGDSRLNVDFLNSIVDETITQLKELGQQVKEAEAELRELVSGAEQVKEEYAQLMNWAELYDKCTFEAKKMIAAQFVKAVHVKRDYEIDVEFNVAFDEFQSIYLEPEKEDEKKRGASTLLALGENVGQAV